MFAQSAKEKRKLNAYRLLSLVDGTMGTSFVEYKGFGFWSRDSFISDWLDVLLAEMRTVHRPQPWQVALTEHWREQAAIDGGMMSLDLDDFLTDPVKEQFILSASRSALHRANSDARRTGELFIDLLDGKLTTTVGSPIDYLE